MSFTRKRLKKAVTTVGAVVSFGALMLGAAGTASADDTPDPGAPIVRAASGSGIVLGTPGGDTVTADKGVAIGDPSKDAPILVWAGIVAKVNPVGGGSACANVASNQKAFNC